MNNVQFNSCNALNTVQGDGVNSYLLFTRSGKAFSVAANYSHVAVAKVEAFSGEVVSCWFLGQRIPANATAL
jgi:hypothetical protein